MPGTNRQLAVWSRQASLWVRMERGSVIDVLGRSPFFGSLTVSHRAELGRRMRRVAYEPNQLIFSRGDPGRDIYLVLEGRVRLSVLTADGRELTFAHAKAGDIFGEIAALDGGERTAGATAITHVEAMLLPQTTALEVITSNPKVATAVIGFLCLRLRETDLRLEAIALHRVEVRLARLLLSALQLGSPVAKDAIPLSLDMSQSELGLLVGASRSKVNVALSLLQDMGAIKRDGAKVTCDPATLQRIVDLE